MNAKRNIAVILLMGAIAPNLIAQSSPAATVAHGVVPLAFGDRLDGITSTAVMLRFQLIAATATPNTDPAISSIDAALKDLFRFPGYRLLSNAAMAVDYVVPRKQYDPVTTDQLLNADGVAYHLSVTVDTAASDMIRIHVWMYEAVKRIATPNPGGGTEYSSDRNTLLNTAVTLSYGRTVVLGSTQPVRKGGSTAAPPLTLILAVKPEIR